MKHQSQNLPTCAKKEKRVAALLLVTSLAAGGGAKKMLSGRSCGADLLLAHGDDGQLHRAEVNAQKIPV